MAFPIPGALVGVVRPRRLHDLTLVGLNCKHLDELRHESRLTSYSAEAALSRTESGVAKYVGFPIPDALVGGVLHDRTHDLLEAPRFVSIFVKVPFPKALSIDGEIHSASLGFLRGKSHC